MEIVHVRLNFLVAAGRHLIVASANGQSVTYFHHVLVTPVCQHDGFDLRNWSVGVGNY